MTLSIGRALGDALALWRRDRDLLLAVVGPFLFLPAFALQLLLPSPEPAPDTTLIAAVRLQGEFVAAHAGAFLAALAVTQFGLVTLVVLYCDHARLAVGEAMHRAVRIWPRYVLASLLVAVPVQLGLVLLVIPGLLVMARTMLVGPLLVADAPLSAAGAIGRSVRATAGQTAVLAALAAICWGAQLLAGEPFLALDRWLRSLHDVNPVALAIADAGFAATGMITELAAVLVSVAAYRCLAGGTSRGI